MNKSILALSTALSIVAFAPAMAQEQTPAAQVDCSLPANASDPACVNNTTNNTMGTNNNTTTGTMTDSTGSTTDPVDQTQMQTGTGAAQMSNDLIVPADQLNGAKMMSASDYIGKAVYDQGGNNIGEVNDLIVSDNGQIQAVILGVGGFLGIGEKDVAVSVRSIQMAQDGDAQRLVIETTKEALEAAPTYDATNRRYAQDGTGMMDNTTTGTGTTGTGTGTGTGTSTTQ